MQISLNGQVEAVPDELTAEGLIVHLSLPGDRLALVINGEVVPKARRGDTPIADGDNVEIITMVGGG